MTGIEMEVVICLGCRKDGTWERCDGDGDGDGMGLEMEMGMVVPNLCVIAELFKL